MFVVSSNSAAVAIAYPGEYAIVSYMDINLARAPNDVCTNYQPIAIQMKAVRC